MGFIKPAEGFKPGAVNQCEFCVEGWSLDESHRDDDDGLCTVCQGTGHTPCDYCRQASATVIYDGEPSCEPCRAWGEAEAAKEAAAPCVQLTTTGAA